MVDRRADRIGQALGPYRLTRLLGAGGFGEVYEADHQLLQQTRAIKLLLEQHFHDPSQRERFLREARTLATLEHPNILPVLEVGEEGNLLYLVMPFYRRGTLNDLLKQCTRPLPLTEVERFLVQMCAAVGYAHARHIAHLDLKPENMLLHEDGRLVLSDFGLAHLIKQGRLEAGSSASWGTPYYMAPEQIRGQPELRSDLYALGVILYQLLTNRRPFTGNVPEAVMMKHLLESPPSLRTVNPQALAALEPVIQKALAKQPADRYPTAEALLTDFRAVVSGSSPRTTQPSVPNVPLAAPTQYPNRPTPIPPTTISVPLGRAPQTAQPANMAQTTGRGCEIPLNNGDICSVPAIGRCATCGRAFCRSHLARWEQAYDINQCAPCLAKAQADEEKWQREAEAKEDEAREYFRSGSARTALLSSGVLPVDIFQIERRAKKGLLNIFSREKLIDVIISVRRGWILGSILGEEQSRRSDSSSYRKWGLTALLDLDHRQAVFTCVEPYLESYKDTNYFRSTTWEIVAWVEAAQAVRQLIMLRHLGIQSIFTRKIPTKQGNKSLERVQVPAGRLGFIRIEEGKEPGRIYEIHEELSIGRSRDRNIFLEDSAMDELDELYASVINQGNGNYVLEVDTEQQRIKVNGQPLPPKDYRGYQTYPLQDGDRIQLDQTAAWGGWGSYVQPGQVVLVFGTK